MEFKDLLRNRRLQINATLEEIGKIVGVSKATVQRWESGEIKNIRRDKIAKLADALHTTPAYLMGWEDQSNVSNANNDKQNSDILSPQEQQLINDFRDLNNHGKEYILTTMHMAKQQYKKDSDISNMENKIG